MTSYSEHDLQCLHEELKSILEEISRVCQLLNIHFFTTGGTAIGAYYFQGFVKWDDDIDLGMRRNDYEVFIKKGPALLSKGFFIQCFETEPNTPFYFTKVRKDGTLFVQTEYKDVPIHHGIFVDIFPFDNVPDNLTVARIHKRLVQYLEGSFLRRQLKQAILEGQRSLPLPISKVLASIRFYFLRLIPKSFFYWRLKKASSLYNGKKCKFVDVIKSSVDHMSVDWVDHLIPSKFEGIDVYIPSNLQGYISNHYPNLKSPDMLETLWISHAPYKLSFSNNESH